MICKWFKDRRKKKLRAIPELPPHPAHFISAYQRLGIEEVRGHSHNPLILDMFRLAVDKEYADEISWCAAFVGACLVENGLESSGKLTARSYLKYGTEVTKPEMGDIVVLWRGSKNSWMGHVGFYAGEGLGFIKVLGGNQSNRVSIAKYPKYRLLGYRRP